MVSTNFYFVSHCITKIAIEIIQEIHSIDWTKIIVSFSSAYQLYIRIIDFYIITTYISIFSYIKITKR